MNTVQINLTFNPELFLIPKKFLVSTDYLYKI